MASPPSRRRLASTLRHLGPVSAAPTVGPEAAGPPHGGNAHRPTVTGFATGMVTCAHPLAARSRDAQCLRPRLVRVRGRAMPCVASSGLFMLSPSQRLVATLVSLVLSPSVDAFMP